MTELFGDPAGVGWVIAKTLLLSLLAVLGLRLEPRRIVAELAPVDFVVATATGAVIGRTATSSTTSFLTGAAALAGLLAVHQVLTRLRLSRVPGGLGSRPPRLLIREGRVLDKELLRARLTRADLNSLLRQQGVQQTGDVVYALYEPNGQLVLHVGSETPGQLLRDGIAAAGYSTQP